MTRVLIANLASPANPGDQAILQGSLKLIRETLNPEKITLVTRAYSQKKAYEDCGCQVVPSYPDVDWLSMDDSWKKVMRIPWALSHPGALWEAVREADYVFLAGGAYFYSYRRGIPGLTYLAHITPVLAALKHHKPVVFLPQSYGPFGSWVSKALFKICLEGARKVFFRENISGDLLQKKFPLLVDKTAYMPDHALYLEKKDLIEQEAHENKANKILGVTVRPWSVEGSSEDYIKALAQALSLFAFEQKAIIRIIVQVQDEKKEEGDEAISCHLQRLLLDKGVPESQVQLFTQRPYFELKQLCNLYHECDLMISMRLHSALLSFVVDCPVLVIGYQHKAAGILKALGLEDLYLGSYHEVDAARIKMEIDRVWQNPIPVKQRIQKALSLARQQISALFREEVL